MIRLNTVEVVILCGGFGKRLRTVVNDRPKPMVKINGRPFLDILIDYVAGYGFRRFILAIGYKGAFIRGYYLQKKNRFEILFSEEDKLLDTAGGIKNAEPLIKSPLFLAMNGDSFCRINLRDFLSFHIRKKAMVSVALTRPEESGDVGWVKLNPRQEIVSFREKSGGSKGAYINAGVYLFNKEVFSFIPEKRRFSLEYDLFPLMAGRRLYGYITDSRLIDIGTKERYKKAKQFFDSYQIK